MKRHDLPKQTPLRIALLPIDDRGYPVPWFVAWVDGKPEFRALDRQKFNRAVKEKRCWICGELLGVHWVFVIGPMCAINRISSEPPSHRDCAEYAIQACPFMAKPHMVRRENDLPAGIGQPAGYHIPRNPGVMMLWQTRSYTVHKVPGGVLFQIGEPEAIACYKEGRIATADEIKHSINTGLPELRKVAESEGPESVADMERKTEIAMKLLGLS